MDRSTESPAAKSPGSTADGTAGIRPAGREVRGRRVARRHQRRARAIGVARVVDRVWTRYAYDYRAQDRSTRSRSRRRHRPLLDRLSAAALSAARTVLASAPSHALITPEVPRAHPTSHRSVRWRPSRPSLLAGCTAALTRATRRSRRPSISARSPHPPAPCRTRSSSRARSARRPPSPSPLRSRSRAPSAPWSSTATASRSTARASSTTR